MRYVGSLCVWHAAANVRAARQVPWTLATSVHQDDIDYGAWSSRRWQPARVPAVLAQSSDRRKYRPSHTQMAVLLRPPAAAGSRQMTWLPRAAAGLLR